MSAHSINNAGDEDVDMKEAVTEAVPSTGSDPISAEMRYWRGKVDSLGQLVAAARLRLRQAQLAFDENKDSSSKIIMDSAQAQLEEDECSLRDARTNHKLWQAKCLGSSSSSSSTTTAASADPWVDILRLVPPSLAEDRGDRSSATGVQNRQDDPARLSHTYTLRGREKQCEQIVGIINTLYNSQVVGRAPEKTNIQFILAAGHVRIGKTRMGDEMPRLVRQVLERLSVDFINPVYIKIDFKDDESRYHNRVDRRDEFGDAVHDSLGYRLARLGLGLKEKDAIRHVEHLTVRRVLKEVIKTFRKGHAENAVLPLVIHFDEHDAFIKKFAQEQRVSTERAVDMFKEEFLSRLGLFIRKGLPRNTLIVPMVTGTSGPDVKAGMPSSYMTKHVQLTPLSLEDSFNMAREGLMYFTTMRPTQIEARMNDVYFHVAIADCGGLPGFIHHLVTAGKPPVWQTELEDIDDYECTTGVPAEALARVISIILSQCTVKRSMVLCERTPEHKRTTLVDLERLGCLHLLGGLNDGDMVTVRAPIPIVRRWLQRIPPELRPIHKKLLDYPCQSFEWTWMHFERLMVSATRLRINNLAALSPTGIVCFQDVFPGARGAQCVLNTPIRLCRVDEAEEERQCVPRSAKTIKWNTLSQPVTVMCQGTKRKRSMDDTVMQCAPNNKLVDARVAFEQPGSNKRLVVLVQYKHSQLESKTAETERHLAKWHDDLDALLPDDADVVLLKVTNRSRRTGGDQELLKRKRLVWVTRDELSELNPLLAHRGLLPTDERKEQQQARPSHSRDSSLDSADGASIFDISPDKRSRESSPQLRRSKRLKQKK